MSEDQNVEVAEEVVAEEVVEAGLSARTETPTEELNVEVAEDAVVEEVVAEETE